MLADYTFAYQPIIDVVARRIVSFEALVRGPGNESAASVMDALSDTALHRFDVEARAHAVRLAVELGLPCHINLNLLPASVNEFGSDALSPAIAEAERHGLSPARLVLEVGEREAVANYDVLVAELHRARGLGVQFAIDDFGAGFSGLNLLAEFQPDTIKLDMGLVRGIHRHGPRQAIVRGVLRTCEDLGIEVIAEGVETLDEYEWLRGEGLTLFQGFLFARPGLRALPEVRYPDL
jgi:EAL domain-containing protein (putative c-di-GMP-specific phosphodiesterase class I)